MNTQEYIEHLIQQQLNDRQRSPFNSINGYKNGLNKINNFGGNLKTSGDFLQGFDNSFANKIGSGITKIGDVLQGGVSKMAPQNVFKGFAQPTNPAIESALSNVLGSTAANTGATIGANTGTGAIGNAVADTAGSSLAGIGSTIGGEAAAGTAAGATTGTAAGTSSAALAGPIGALVTLGAMAIDGANRKRSKQSGENLLKQTNQMTEAIQNDTTNQEFADQMVQQSQNNITGGAAPITEADITGLDNEMAGLKYTPQQRMLAMQGINGGDSNINNLIQKYNVEIPKTDDEIEAAKQGLFNKDGERMYPPQTGQVTENVQLDDNIENVKKGLLNKFMSGLGDFSQGYQENRNTGFAPENLNQDRFAETKTVTTPNQQLVDYQNNLRNQGIDENIINAVAEGKNSGNKEIDEWIKANPDALKPVTNTKTTYTGKEKGKMARAGEFFGTTARALQKPAVQALLAGGLSTALTGNPLYGLGQGYKFANTRAMDNIYRDVLKQNGVNIPESGTFGNVTNQDLGTIGRLAETRAYHDSMQQRYDLDRELRRLIAENNDRHKNIQDKIAQQNADARTTSAQAQIIKANKPAGGGRKTTGGSGKAPKPQQNPDWNKDLAGYIQRINDSRYATKINQLKAGFITKYGVDPDKFIKD